MNERYHGLDFTRAVLMFLGIFYHSALIFHVNKGWLITAKDSSEFFSFITAFLHAFRMEAFYILAGFFFFLLLEKKPLKVVLMSRVKVILIPLFFVGFTLNFVMNNLSVNRDYTYDLNYILNGEWLGHLWFIGNLFVYYFIALLFKNPLLKFKTDNKIVITVVSLLLVPFMSVILSSIGVKIEPSAFIFVKFVYFFKYFPYFIFGMYFYICRDSVFNLMTVKVLLLLFFLVCLSLLVIHQFDSFNNAKVYKILTFFYSGYIGFSSLIILNFCFSKGNVYLQRVVESSYSVYLLHQPIILILFYFVFSKTNLNIYVTYSLLCFFTLVLSFSLHYYLIKNNALSLLLFNGKSLNKK